MKTHILGVPFDNVTRKQALETLLSYLSTDSNHMLFTPNPEMVMRAQKDPEFMDILANGDLIVPDGIGIVIASRFQPIKIRERVAGCDLVMELMANVTDPTTVYLLGAKDGVCELAKAKLESDLANIKVIGYHHGYFDAKDETIILDEIRSKKPDVLLVGLGFPRQEKWIYAHRDLPVKISAGVGGSIDVMAGTVKRAPAFYRKLGLEWLYRALKQPSRIARLAVLPAFVIRVIFNGLKRR